MGKSAQIGFHVWLADAMEGKIDNTKKAARPILKVSYNRCSIINQVRCYSTKKGSTKLPELTQFQKEVVAGMLFSDGHLRNPNSSKRATGNYRLEFTFKSAVLAFCN